MNKPYKIPKGKFVYCLMRARAAATEVRDSPITWPHKSLVGLYRKRCRDNGFGECRGGCRAVPVELKAAKESNA